MTFEEAEAEAERLTALTGITHFVVGKVVPGREDDFDYRAQRGGAPVCANCEDL
ncbi:MAG: hypothetical protein PHW13_11940 [Methylococcales bacterium]|nr:hypothetical protein [Methylococcales bacterium]